MVFAVSGLNGSLCGLVAMIRVRTCSGCFIWGVVEPFDLVLCTATVCFISSKWVLCKKHVVLERGRSL